MTKVGFFAETIFLKKFKKTSPANKNGNTIEAIRFKVCLSSKVIVRKLHSSVPKGNNSNEIEIILVELQQVGLFLLLAPTKKIKT